MTKALFLLPLLLGWLAGPAAADVLIVADEMPAMQFLSAKLEAEEHIASRLVTQKELPGRLNAFEAVLVYIHGPLAENAENAFIAYAENGGKLVLLHHSISSGKRKNAHWFEFLGVSLPEGPLTEGGYKWIEPAPLTLVRLDRPHFITTNRVTFPSTTRYGTTNSPTASRASLTLDPSEVYLNHRHTRPHTTLLGLKYTDPKSGITYEQDTAGWIMAAGKGSVVYLMAGHTQKDFENPVYGRIVLNAVIWKPQPALP